MACLPTYFSSEKLLKTIFCIFYRYLQIFTKYLATVLRPSKYLIFSSAQGEITPMI